MTTGVITRIQPFEAFVPKEYRDNQQTWLDEHIKDAESMLNMVLERAVAHQLTDGRAYLVQFFPTVTKKEYFDIQLTRSALVLLIDINEAQIGECAIHINGSSASWEMEMDGKKFSSQVFILHDKNILYWKRVA